MPWATWRHPYIRGPFKVLPSTSLEGLKFIPCVNFSNTHRQYFLSLFHITRQIIYFPNKIFNLLLLLSYFLLSVKIIQHRRIILRNACLLLLTGLTSSLLGLLLGCRSRVIRVGTTILILAFVVSNSASCITVIIHSFQYRPDHL